MTKTKKKLLIFFSVFMQIFQLNINAINLPTNFTDLNIFVPQKILVTGGEGFIGSHFIKYVLKQNPNCKIVCYDNETYAANRHYLDGLDIERLEIIKGDICDKKDLEQAMKDCDAVVHFAAESHVDRSNKNATPFRRTNIEGTRVIGELVAKLENVKRFIYISTDEVYGQIKNGSFKETDKLDPRNPYSQSKFEAEQLLLQNPKIKKKLIITRSSNNLGPHQHPEKLVPRIIASILLNLPFPLHGQGTAIRDWIYVTDNCSGIYKVLTVGLMDGEIYNIGGKDEISNLNILEYIASTMAQLGNEKLVLFSVPDRINQDERYSLDTTKLNRLGWKIEGNIYIKLNETINFYIQQKNLWLHFIDDDFLGYLLKYIFGEEFNFGLINQKDFMKILMNIVRKHVDIKTKSTGYRIISIEYFRSIAIAA